MSSNTHNYNDEMLAGINHLKEKRESVSQQIEAEKDVHSKLAEEIATLNDRL